MAFGVVADATAVDDAGGVDGGGCVLPVRADDRADRPRLARLGAQERAAAVDQLAAGDRAVDQGGRARRDAVAVNVPPRDRVAQEAGALGQRRGLPQRDRMRADVVDGIAPVLALGPGAAGEVAGPAGDDAHRRTERHVGGVHRERVAAGHVRARQKTAARDGDDLAAMVGAGQRQDLVHHRQARAHDHHRAVRVDPVDAFPRAARQAARVGSRNGMAGGEDREVGRDRRAVRQPRHDAAAGVVQPLADALHVAQPVAASAGAVAQLVGQVVAIGAAADEALLGHPRPLGARLEPAEEMQRIVGVRRHHVGAGVQQVVGIGGRISDPPAGAIRPLDQRHGDPVRLPQQMRRHQRPGRTTAEDQDVKAIAARFRVAGRVPRLGFVGTGHLRLCRLARRPSARRSSGKRDATAIADFALRLRPGDAKRGGRNGADATARPGRVTRGRRRCGSRG